MTVSQEAFPDRDVPVPAEELARASLGPDASSLSLASRSVHADDGIASHRAVAPALHVSTTFRYNDDPDLLAPGGNVDVSQDSSPFHRQC